MFKDITLLSENELAAMVIAVEGERTRRRQAVQIRETIRARKDFGVEVACTQCDGTGEVYTVDNQGCEFGSTCVDCGGNGGEFLVAADRVEAALNEFGSLLACVELMNSEVTDV